VERARAAGIERILVPGWDVASSEAAVSLALAHPDLLDAAVGIHPHHVATATADDWRRLEELATEPAVAAIGEIGLDFFRNLSPPEEQRRAFSRQLELAAAIRRPVLVHDREAHDEVTAALLGTPSEPDPGVRGVLHCFSGNAPMALRLSEAGYLISFALPVAFSSAKGPRAAAVALPDGSFLLETDAPWLAPGGGAARNEPTTVLRVAAELARLRGTTPDEVARQAALAYGRLVVERVAYRLH